MYSGVKYCLAFPGPAGKNLSASRGPAPGGRSDFEGFFYPVYMIEFFPREEFNFLGIDLFPV